MKKLLILGTLCVFSIMNLQTAQAEDFKKDFKKERPQIEHKKDFENNKNDNKIAHHPHKRDFHKPNNHRARKSHFSPPPRDFYYPYYYPQGWMYPAIEYRIIKSDCDCKEKEKKKIGRKVKSISSKKKFW